MVTQHAPLHFDTDILDTGTLKHLGRHLGPGITIVSPYL